MADADLVKQIENRSICLLREYWATIQQLAEEVYAVLNRLQQNKTKDGEIPDPDSPATPFTINGGDNDDSSFQVVGDDGELNLTGRGDLDFTPYDSQPLDDPSSPSKRRKKKKKKRPALVAIGKVLGGKGQFYQVEIFGDGLIDSDEENARPPVEALESTVTVEAMQVQIAEGERIPPGTAVYLVRVKGRYYMQAPVWLLSTPIAEESS